VRLLGAAWRGLGEAVLPAVRPGLALALHQGGEVSLVLDLRPGIEAARMPGDDRALPSSTRTSLSVVRTSSVR
jgi:hypothetical protein